jgi:uncharacterized protein
VSRGKSPLRPPALPAWLRAGADFVTIQVLARPGSSRQGVIRLEERGVVTGLHSKAEKGKANEELIEAIAKFASVPRSSVSIIQGAGARNKVLRIATADPKKTACRFLELAVNRPE